MSFGYSLTEDAERMRDTSSSNDVRMQMITWSAEKTSLVSPFSRMTSTPLALQQERADQNHTFVSWLCQVIERLCVVIALIQNEELIVLWEYRNEM